MKLTENLKFKFVDIGVERIQYISVKCVKEEPSSKILFLMCQCVKNTIKKYYSFLIKLSHMLPPNTRCAYFESLVSS